MDLEKQSCRLKEAGASLRDAELMCTECGKIISCSYSGPSPRADGNDDSTHPHIVTMVTVARLEEDIACALARCVCVFCDGAPAFCDDSLVGYPLSRTTMSWQEDISLRLINCSLP